ncbi:hypothetical protein D3C78_773940 [compost metagenome]
MVHLATCINQQGLAQLLVQAGIHAERVVPLDLVALLAFHRQVVIGLDAGDSLVVDIGVLVMLDMPSGVVLDKQVQVFLTVDVDLFLPSLVFEAQLVEPLPLVGFGAQHGAGLVGWQLVRRAVGGVEGATRDDGLVRVPFEETHDNLVADARDGHHAVLTPRPALADSHPAGALVVGAAVSVPGELQLHPAVLVAVNLLPLRAHHHGDLRTVHHGPGRHQRSPGSARFHHPEFVVVDGGATAPLLFQRLGLQASVLDAHHLPISIQVAIGVFGQRKILARQQGGAVGLATAGDGVIAQGIESVLGKGLAARVQLVAARIVEVLVGVALVGQLRPHFLVGEAISRGLEAVVFELHIRGAHRLAVVELPHIGALLEGTVTEVEEELGAGGQRRRVIGKHDTMLALLEFVEVEQAFFCGQSVDEIEVGLPVLDAVFPLGVLVFQGKGIIGDAVLLQQNGEDFIGLLRLEDAGVLAKG